VSITELATTGLQYRVKTAGNGRIVTARNCQPLSALDSWTTIAHNSQTAAQYTAIDLRIYRRRPVIVTSQLLARTQFAIIPETGYRQMPPSEGPENCPDTQSMMDILLDKRGAIRGHHTRNFVTFCNQSPLFRIAKMRHTIINQDPILDHPLHIIAHVRGSYLYRELSGSNTRRSAKSCKQTIGSTSAHGERART